MRNIKIKVLNPEIIDEIHKTMKLAAKITQHSHEYNSIDDVLKDYSESSKSLQSKLADLPHMTLKTFNKINVIVYGASRRFLAQITRHQVGVTFMSGSLQYSDYSKKGKCVVPYDILDTEKEFEYEKFTNMHTSVYNFFREMGYDPDSCGFVMPQGLRNVLLISADVEAWQHMIAQRVCRRNSSETRYVMLKIWQELNKLDPILFGEYYCECCKEGDMSCKRSMRGRTIHEILISDFEKLEGNTNATK